MPYQTLGKKPSRPDQFFINRGPRANQAIAIAIDDAPIPDRGLTRYRNANKRALSDQLHRAFRSGAARPLRG